MKTMLTWRAALDPTIGSEIQKTRPCLIISPAEIHDHLRTVIVAPMTSGSHPSRLSCPRQLSGCHWAYPLGTIRALDNKRLVKRLGSIPAAVLRQTLRTLRELYEE